MKEEKERAQADDLSVLKGTATNKYGHIAIIAKVTEYEVEIRQQSPGAVVSSGAFFYLEETQEEGLKRACM